MNNKDYISELADRTGNTKQMTQKMVLSVMDTLVSQVEEEESLQIPLFGTFERKKRLERILSNPNGVGKILVPPKLIMSFRPVASWKQNIQKGGADDEQD